MPSVRLLYPKPSTTVQVAIQRGDFISLSIDFLDSELYTDILAANCAAMSLQTRLEQPRSRHNSLVLSILLWTITGGAIYPNQFCDRHRPRSFETGECGCLVRFHSRYFPIKGQKAEICFEFPTTGKGCRETQVYKYVSSYAHFFAVALKWMQGTQ